MKKIGLSLLSLFVIFGFGVSFANPIAPTLYCNVIENVEIDNYRVIAEYGKKYTNLENSDSDNSGRESPSFNGKREVYELKAKECTKCSYWWHPKVYLLDKSIDIKDITQENIADKAIFVGEINSFECSDSYYDKVDIYKITKNGNSYQLELSKTTNENIKRKIKNNLKVFPYAWLVTIIVETICIFLIAKCNRKEDEISNKKLILSGIIPTTITLPLLRFGLSLLEFGASGGGELVIAILLSYFIGELVVVIIESCIIKYYLRISRGKAIKASIICNIVSLILGALILKWLDGLVY